MGVKIIMIKTESYKKTTEDNKEKFCNEKYREFVDIFCECRKELNKKLLQAYEEGYINDLKEYMATIDASHLEHMIAQEGRGIERRLDFNQWELSPYYDTPVRTSEEYVDEVKSEINK